MKIFFTLLLLIPSLSWGDVIYCYQFEEMQFTDLSNTKEIHYIEINDSQKKITYLKSYYDLYISEPKFHIYSDKEKNQLMQNTIYEVFDDTHIKLNDWYIGGTEEKDSKTFYFAHLDRVAGIMIDYVDIYEDENGDLYTYGKTNDGKKNTKFFKKDNSQSFWNNSFHRKYICEKSKKL